MTDKQILADSHVHTDLSHDCRCSAREQCEAAVQNGVSVLTFTNHCDVSFCRWESNCDNVLETAEQVKEMNGIMGDCLEVIADVEVGDGGWNPKMARYVSGLDVDSVLGSVHTVAYKHYSTPLSVLNFKGWDNESLDSFMTEYFNEVEELIEACDINVLAHLTVPMKYINGKCGNGYTLERFEERIAGILEAIIKRNIALEVNTSAYAVLSAPMPDYSILKMYRELGGELITLASDAHTGEFLGSNFRRVLGELRKIGFERYHYVKKRGFVPIDIL